MTKTPAAAATIAIRVRRLPGRWPTYRVTEVTEAGGYRNAYDFQRSDEARSYARKIARELGVEVAQ
jgi:hypothetical protein